MEENVEKKSDSGYFMSPDRNEETTLKRKIGIEEEELVEKIMFSDLVQFPLDVHSTPELNSSVSQQKEIDRDPFLP